jgi:hypothetical protein
MTTSGTSCGQTAQKYGQMGIRLEALQQEHLVFFVDNVVDILSESVYTDNRKQIGNTSCELLFIFLVLLAFFL